MRWDTDSVVFVADDLGAWLVGFLAETGRKKLTALVLGTGQERALQSTATAAVRLTAEQLCPDDAQHAEQVALVISQVFRQPVPAESPTGRETVLEALRAAISGQLAVLDDASTGTGQSSADVLGIPAAIITAELMEHLLREITSRGQRLLLEINRMSCATSAGYA